MLALKVYWFIAEKLLIALNFKELGTPSIGVLWLALLGYISSRTEYAFHPLLCIIYAQKPVDFR